MREDCGGAAALARHAVMESAVALLDLLTGGAAGSAGSTMGVAATLGAGVSAAIGFLRRRRKGRPDKPKSGNAVVSALEAADLGDVLSIALDRRSGTRLGVSIAHQGDSLLITHVKERGAVATWNEEHPDAQVQPGDSILEVNGVRGSATVLRSACKLEELLHIKVRQAAPMAKGAAVEEVPAAEESAPSLAVEEPVPAAPALEAAPAAKGAAVEEVLSAEESAPSLVVEEPVPAAPALEAASNFYDVMQRNRTSGVPLSFEGVRHHEETAQDRVFNWLGRAPAPGSDCFWAVQRFFPGALPGSAVHLRSRCVLENNFGFTPANTLLGTSFCPDEINNQTFDLSTLMRKYWGKVFPMGGIGGAPYVGETGFKAFSSHVADNGNIIVIFGPHVGISVLGEVGQYLREGQQGNSTACGAVIGALNACLSGAGAQAGDGEEYDMQMDEIKQEFAPHAEKLSNSENSMASAAYQAYEMVKDRMLKIVNTKFGSGKLVLIGGIQLNMPHPELEDHFLPMMFEVRQEGQPTQDLMHHFVDASTQQDLNRAPWAANSAQREVFAWLSWSPPPLSPLYESMHKYFPGALPGQAVHERTLRIVERFGFTDENTIMGTSVCPDEMNNESMDLTVLMQDYWGEVFPMGGISGAPFAGKTGFKAFSSHVAEDGHIIVMFGPHVAISEAGEVGMCLRHGQQNESTACGAVIGAYKACLNGDFGDGASGSYDMQMDWIKRQIAPHVNGIQRTESPMAALAHKSYAMVRDKIFDVVNNDFGSGYLCLVGGIQINLPYPMEDHFLPCTFEMRRAGEDTLDLLKEMEEFS